MDTYRITLDLPNRKTVSGKVMAEDVSHAVSTFYAMVGEDATAKGITLEPPVAVRAAKIVMKSLAIRHGEKQARKPKPENVASNGAAETKAPAAKSVVARRK